jgi:hypothetical protein
MNYSDQHQLVWFAPVRTGSRATGCVLRHLDFIDGVTGRNLFDAAHTHCLSVPVGKEGYRLLCNVRNPYRRMVSVYVWSNPKVPFIDWVELSDQDHIFYERALSWRFFRPIRTEYLERDLLSIDVVANAMQRSEVSHDFDYWIRNNRFRNVEDLASFYADPRAIDVVKEKCRDQFELFGYSSDFEAAI